MKSRCGPGDGRNRSGSASMVMLSAGSSDRQNGRLFLGADDPGLNDRTEQRGR
jgi:hypothetical protein